MPIKTVGESTSETIPVISIVSPSVYVSFSVASRTSSGLVSSGMVSG